MSCRKLRTTAVPGAGQLKVLSRSNSTESRAISASKGATLESQVDPRCENTTRQHAEPNRWSGDNFIGAGGLVPNQMGRSVTCFGSRHSVRVRLRGPAGSKTFNRRLLDNHESRGHSPRSFAAFSVSSFLPSPVPFGLPFPPSHFVYLALSPCLVPGIYFSAYQHSLLYLLLSQRPMIVRRYWQMTRRST